MWVFGYGSLMWDGWENSRGCLRRVLATLPGFRRAFNKESVRNWGTREQPGPTLNLEADPASNCKGMAFKFPDEKQHELLAYLRNREACEPVLREIKLESGPQVIAFVSIYAGKNLIRDKTLAELAEMARKASGSSGRCFDYVRGIIEKLSDLGLDDPAVTEFWQAIQQQL